MLSPREIAHFSVDDVIPSHLWRTAVVLSWACQSTVLSAQSSGIVLIAAHPASIHPQVHNIYLLYLLGHGLGPFTVSITVSSYIWLRCHGTPELRRTGMINLPESRGQAVMRNPGHHPYIFGIIGREPATPGSGRVTNRSGSRRCDIDGADLFHRKSGAQGTYRRCGFS